MGEEWEWMGCSHGEIGGSASQAFQCWKKYCYLLNNKYEQFVANIYLLGGNIGQGPPIPPSLPNHFLIWIPASVTQFSWEARMLSVPGCLGSHLRHPAPLAEVHSHTPLSHLTSHSWLWPQPHLQDSGAHHSMSCYGHFLLNRNFCLNVT